jgi:hypothetical protein
MVVNRKSPDPRIVQGVHGNEDNNSGNLESFRTRSVILSHTPRGTRVAVFWWSVSRNKSPETLWPAYPQGYIAVRHLDELERKALPLFVAARQIWYLGGQTSLVPQFGSARLDDRFRQPNLAFPRNWISLHMGKA